MKYLTKKKFLLFSILFLLIPLAAIIIQETCDYKSEGWCRENWTLLGELGKTTLWPSILLISLTLMTFIFQNSIFEAWKKFAIWGIPVLLVLTYLVTRDTSSHNFFSMDFSLYFLAILYSLFFLISLMIIVVTAFRNK